MKWQTACMLMSKINLTSQSDKGLMELLCKIYWRSANFVGSCLFSDPSSCKWTNILFHCKAESISSKSFNIPIQFVPALLFLSQKPDIYLLQKFLYPFHYLNGAALYIHGFVSKQHYLFNQINTKISYNGRGGAMNGSIN